MRARHWVAIGPRGLSDFSLVETDAPDPSEGEVTITVQAAGVNPADLKHAQRAAEFPLPIGYEVAGILTAIGPNTQIGSGPAELGSAVVAFRIRGGYATRVTVPAEKVFVRPGNLDAPAAANLLLAGTTAMDMLHVIAAQPGETVALFGASGSVGAMVLQIARARGIHVVGICGEGRAAEVQKFGGIAVERGEELAERILCAAGVPIAAVLDASGATDARETGPRVASDFSRMVTIVGSPALVDAGFVAIAGAQPDSAAYRDSVRGELLDMVADGALVVPVAQTFALDQAIVALEQVVAGRAGGKVALMVDSPEA